jgi:hypothetical protein
MPADADVSGLHLAQPLPLMKPFALWTELSLSIASAALTIPTIGSFTMPFFGDMVYQGWLQIRMNSAGVQQPSPIAVALESSPVPSFAPRAIWRTEGGPGYAEGTVPIIASWSAVAANTAVTVRAYVQNGTGVPGLTIVRAVGIMFCTKT